MKNSLRNILLYLSLVAVSSVGAAGLPMLNVTVFDSAGQVAYRGHTDAGGVFASGQLQPGDYIVQFNSSGTPNGEYALVVSAGKQKVVAEAVPAEKFAKGGIAMKVKVGTGMNVTGQVSPGKTGVLAKNAGSTKVKIVDGKRYVWIGRETGSNISGRWVEEDTPAGRDVIRMSTQDVASLQGRGDPKAPTLPAGR